MLLFSQVHHKGDTHYAAFAAGVPLAEEDRAVLMERATAYVTAFDDEDAEAFVALTHSAIYRLVADRANLLPAAKLVMKTLRDRSFRCSLAYLVAIALPDGNYDHN